MLACVHVVYRADLYTVFGPKADIVGQVHGLCVCMCVCECRCLHACVRVVYRTDLYTIFGPIPYSGGHCGSGSRP